MNSSSKTADFDWPCHLVLCKCVRICHGHKCQWQFMCNLTRKALFLSLLSLSLWFTSCVLFIIIITVFVLFFNRQLETVFVCLFDYQMSPLLSVLFSNAYYFVPSSWHKIKSCWWFHTFCTAHFLTFHKIAFKSKQQTGRTSKLQGRQYYWRCVQNVNFVCR